jgi:hypothetical protein
MLEKKICVGKMATSARPTDDLKSLLIQRAETRARTSRRIGLATLAVVTCLSGISIWSAVALDKKVHTNVLYGLMGAYIFILVLISVHTAFNVVKSGLLSGGSVESFKKVHSWQRRGYKLLTSTVVLEHGLFFCSVPIVIFHSLGLSLTRCFSQRACTGISYSTWFTVSASSTRRIQELVSLPVSVEFSKSQIGIFASFTTVLGLSLICLGVFWYKMYRRRSPSSTVKDSRKSLSAINTVEIGLMSLCAITQCILSVIGITVIGSHWFIIGTVLSIVSLYPIWQLYRSCLGHSTVTRLQFRRISQQCLSVLFLWLYSSGSGIGISLASPIRLIENGTTLIDTESIAQLVALLVAHLCFSILSAIGMHLHLSLTDILGSFLKTVAEDPNEHPAVVVDDTIQRHASKALSWNSETCASCSTNRTNTVLVPCGHSVICRDCANALLAIPGFKCPMCCVEVFDLQTS